MVAAAAYRSGTLLRDAHYGVTHNYRGKRGVTHSEIMAPAGTAVWALEREALWNAVEAREHRKDAQLARLVEVGLPVELSADERLDLVRDFVRREFVHLGMIADVCVRGTVVNPHAHILLTLRTVTALGFGPKQRQWNGKAVLLGWRAAWAQCANEHLARAGHAVRIDHRTLEAQQIELTPARRVGVDRARRDARPLPPHLAARLIEQQRIAEDNGRMIIEDPTVALKALTQQQPIFTYAQLVRFLGSRTGDGAQLAEALTAVTQSPDCVALEGSAGRFTSRLLLEAEAALAQRAAQAARRARSRPGMSIDGNPDTPA